MQTNIKTDEAVVDSRDHGEHPETGHEVTVTVNGQPMQVHRGSYIVSDFKKKVGVEASQELDQVIDGQFKPLGDNERIVIKGDEVFVSHGRGGGSS